ncbi:hypothetical protein FR932_03925 [Moritella marina ATCC 15381]|uniref:Uncharacterized protein n=1 Tax=Moritella marina ATCC 15381 TaxID=1202962 RepID=A0A5J6WGD4_MORMI|nr:hypothetical protein [Moritella marina]QFI37036.1 hypothetical protein FR932_03925 [Moritella marina ATCC 15381]
MRIFIEKKSYRSFVSSRSLGSFQVAVLLFIIHHSTSGRANYIYLNKLHFLFDLVICEEEFSGFPKFTIPPWNIDKDLKNKIIVLVKNELIEQTYDGNKVRFALTEKGNENVLLMNEIRELSIINEKIINLSKSVTTTIFDKSKVIF